jgi:hypothetical protein
MACRGVSSFVVRDLDLWPCDAAAIHAASNLYSGMGAALRGQSHQTFVV